MAAQQGASQEQPRRRSRFAVPAEAAADGNGDPLDLGAAVRTLATALVTATRTVVNQEEAISLPPEKRRKTTSSSTATTSTTTLDAALALTAASLLEVPLQQPTAAPALQRLPILNWGLWREHVLPCLGPRDLVRLGHVNRHYRLLHANDDAWAPWIARLVPAGHLEGALATANAFGFLPGHRLHHRALRHVYMAATARRCPNCSSAWAAHVNLLTVRAQCPRCFGRWCDAQGGLMLRSKAARQYLLEAPDLAALPSVSALVDSAEARLVSRAHAEALAVARYGSLATVEEAKPRREAQAVKRRVRFVAKATRAGMTLVRFVSVSPVFEPINPSDRGRGVTAEALAHFVLCAVGFPDKDDPARALRPDEVSGPHDFVVCRFCLDAISESGGARVLPGFPGCAKLFAEHHVKECRHLPAGLALC